MSKIIRFAISVVLLFPLVINSGVLDNKNLKGLNYSRIQCEFNGTTYYKGFKKPTALEIEEFNLELIEKQLKETNIPITKNNIQSIYTKMETLLKKEGIRIVEMRINEENSSSSILPIITLHFDVMEGPDKTYFSLAYLTVSKWISSWSGTQNTQAHVITWWQKNMMFYKNEELGASIEEASKILLEDFIIQLKDANLEEEVKKEEQVEKNNK